MSKTSRLRNTNRIITVPKNLLIFRKETSPYNKTKDSKNNLSTKLIIDPKSKNRPVLKRGKTLIDQNYEDDIACLISVERNFVRELINSPLKYNSKSPMLVKKNTSSPVKPHQLNNKFESLTVCDFLSQTNNGKINGIRRNKSSITPDPFIKRNK